MSSGLCNERSLCHCPSALSGSLLCRLVLLPLCLNEVTEFSYALVLHRLMLRHRLDAIGLESDPNSSALRDAAEDTSTERVLELMLTPAGDEIMGRWLPEDRVLVLNDARL